MSTTREIADAVREHVRANCRSAYETLLGTDNPLKQQGIEWYARCTLHDDGKASFRLNLGKAQWLCDPCGEGGDIFTFYGRLHQLNTKNDFARIASELAAAFGLSVKGTGRKTTIAAPSSHPFQAACWAKVVYRKACPSRQLGCVIGSKANRPFTLIGKRTLTSCYSALFVSI
jgi:hypothetical protein